MTVVVSRKGVLNRDGTTMGDFEVGVNTGV
jgi:hypothetical protein